MPAMKVRYFADTDTLYIAFSECAISDTRDLDGQTLADYDARGHVCAITVEAASQRTDVARIDAEGIDR